MHSVSVGNVVTEGLASHPIADAVADVVAGSELAGNSYHRKNWHNL